MNTEPGGGAPPLMGHHPHQGMPTQMQHMQQMGQMPQHMPTMQQQHMPQMGQMAMPQMPQMHQQMPHTMSMPQNYSMMQPQQMSQMPQMPQMQHMPMQHMGMSPGRGMPTGDHPLMSATGDQYLVIRRPPPIPEVRVRCGRDEQCVKENGHRGRCSLQHRLREEDMLRLVEKISTLQTEIDSVKVERDRYQNEVSSYWTGVQKTCTFLSALVCSKRQLQSGSIPTAEECQAELRGIATQLFQVESKERHEQFAASLTLLEQSLPDNDEEPESARRQSEIDEYKRQFEQRLQSSRDAHESATEQAIAELVPFMMTAPQRLTAGNGGMSNGAGSSKVMAMPM